jgi:hypothetical protein
MRVEFGDVSLGNFLCSVPASCRSVALRVFIAVLSCILGLVLMPLGSLASITSVGWMWYVCIVLEVCFLGSISSYAHVPVSQSGARCLRSLLE